MPVNNIVEANSIKDILKSIKPVKSLVIFDLDNTLITPKVALGSDEWFCAMLNHAMNRIADRNTALTVCLSVYHEVQKISRAEIIEDVARKLIRAFNDIGIPVLAVTARDECLRTATSRQLKEVGISFSKGIVFCSGRNKGECLLERLNTIHVRNVVMMDDKRKHLQDVGEILNRHNINFHGFRFGYLDEKVNNFNLSETFGQLREIKTLLPETIQEHVDLLTHGEGEQEESKEDLQCVDTTNFYVQVEETQNREPHQTRLMRRHSIFGDGRLNLANSNTTPESINSSLRA